MGKLVSFWSPFSGHGKATSSLCAVLGGFLTQYPELSIAVSHTRKDAAGLINKLDMHAAVWNEKGWLDVFGINSMKIYGRQNSVTKECVRRFGLPLSGKSLYFFPNHSQNDNDDKEAYSLLTNYLKREFDIVFLDLESGKTENSLQYMKASDYVIIVLPQDPMYVERFLYESGECFSETEYGIVFGGWLLNSQYSKAYYRRKYGNKLCEKIVGEILWNADFFDALSSGKSLDFIFRNYATVKKEDNYDFILQIKKTAERISKKIIG